MRNYIILNGVNSNTITGLLISTLPPITKPKIRTQTEEIDGRDGDIVTKLGYSAYDKELEIGLYGDFDINEVISYFNSEGTVTFSNEPDKYYNYQILDQIDYEKLIRFKTANVKMHVQPFKYPLEETPVEITIQNVTGSGENIDLDNTAEAPLTIALKGNTSQDGTPTPSAPIPVETVTGEQAITVCGKNLWYDIPDRYSHQGVTLTKADDGGYVLNGTTTGVTIFNFNLPVPIEQGTYVLSIKASANIPNNVVLRARGSNMAMVTPQSQVQGNNTTSNSNSFTCTTDIYTLALNLSTSGVTYNNLKIYPMIEKSSTATTYEPYQGNTYNIDLPVENLFDKDNANYINGWLDGTTMRLNTINGNRMFYIPCKPNTTYTISRSVITSSFRTTTYDSTPFPTVTSSNINYTVPTVIQNNSGTTLTITTNANAKYLIVHYGKIEDTNLNEMLATIQVEYGSKQNSYTPYGTTPIELCKIGDYQDRIYKDNGKWYIEKQIGKVVLDGTQNITLASSGNRRFNANYTTLGISNIKDGTSNVETANYRINSHFQYNSSNTNWGNYYMYSNWLVLFDANSVIASANDLKTWFANNLTSIYYVLATPTTTEITDTELIGQLEAIKTARSYDTTTHINQNTANKPFIIDATAVQKGTDTGIVDNEGNIYSKPTIDIEGSGIADIYLNGNQIFSIDLSTINECVIDTTNLEAYNPTTNILMNRQVTGDYSNFKLNAGDNEVKISGAVTKATISNYTRWL